MTHDAQVIAAITQHGPMRTEQLRDSLRIGKNGFVSACARLVKRGEIVRVCVGRSVIYGRPEHQAGLLQQQRAHDDKMAVRQQARDQARRISEERAQASRKKASSVRYAWPDKSRYSEPSPIPVSIFDYARQAGAAS